MPGKSETAAWAAPVMTYGLRLVAWAVAAGFVGEWALRAWIR